MTTTPAQASAIPGEQPALLASSRRGDEGAFGQLVEPYRTELHAHCYRMLGSVHDAEDALQDALLRAWRGIARFEGRSSVRSWLYRIATNVCLSAIERRPPRRLAAGHGQPGDPHVFGEEPPLVETVWIEPYADEQLALADGRAAPAARYEQRESVELAFVAALQLLPARQRATLIMREVLGFSAREVADSLDTTVAAVNSALQRARRTLDEELPGRPQQVVLRELGDEHVRDLVRRYADALEQADIPAVLALLTEDATWSMPPWSSWYRGYDAITVFLREHALNNQTWKHIATHANGQAAVACYLRSPDGDCYEAAVIDVLTLEGARIAAVTAFVTPEIFPRFGLPGSLPLSGGRARRSRA
jgi:RNA polymerase sigma-70 factor, ECF subfamily